VGGGDKTPSRQNKNGKQSIVACNYKLNGTEVTFEFPQGYDSSVDLIIDPVLIFSTLLSG
jgi:hypothetical protein